MSTKAELAAQLEAAHATIAQLEDELRAVRDASARRLAQLEDELRAVRDGDRRWTTLSASWSDEERVRRVERARNVRGGAVLVTEVHTAEGCAVSSLFLPSHTVAVLRADL